MSEVEPRHLKVLVLTAEGREPDFSRVYAALSQHVQLTVHTLSKTAQKNLRAVLRRLHVENYDRLLLDLRFKYVHTQVALLRTVTGLVIYEEDACQNYLANSRWQGEFSKFYRALPSARIVVTGASVARRLQQEGIDAHFLPKGYDETLLYDEHITRDVEIGFIGRLSSQAYAQRKELLETLAHEDGLQLLRTQPGSAYRQGLNRIRFFVSADIGLEEYMAKNFEAMACGCVLLAWQQGEEEQAIGLESGRHLLLYHSIEELRAQLQWLRDHPQEADLIARTGEEFAAKYLTHTHLAVGLASVLRLAPRPVPLFRGWRSALQRYLLR